MKCSSHPANEAVGTCSKCGEAICQTCKEAKIGKPLCRNCLQIETTLPRRSLHNLIGALSGWLGAVNSFMIGFYVVATYIEIALLSRENGETLFYPVCTAVILTMAATLVLVCGSYSIWKGNTRRGGITNITAATVLIPIYAYFTFFSQPSLLRWLGPIGAFLLIPAILSGTVGLLVTK